MSDTDAIPENLVNCPITLYFFETKAKVKGKWTFMKWLELLDKDSFSMILESIEAIQSIPKDKFNPEIPTSEGQDIAMLHIYVLLEEKYKNIDMNILNCLKEKAVEKLLEQNDVIYMLDYISYEELRRKGIVTIIGSGKLLDKNTNIEVIEKALITGKKEINYNIDTDTMPFEVFREFYESDKRDKEVFESIAELEKLLSTFSEKNTPEEIEKIKKALYRANENYNKECMIEIKDRNDLIKWTIENADSNDEKIGMKDHLPFLMGLYLDKLKNIKSNTDGFSQLDEDCDYEEWIDDRDDPANYWKKS